MSESPPPSGQVPLGIVIARIFLVTGTAFAAAFAVFFLVAAHWAPGLIALLVTAVFLALMFLIERAAA